MTITINELIRRINAGELTVEGAVDVIEEKKMTYGIKYFRPSSRDEMPYWDMLKEWKRRQAEKEQVQKGPAQEIDQQGSVQKTGQIWESCRCGNEPVNLPLMLCDACWSKKSVRT